MGFGRALLCMGCWGMRLRLRLMCMISRGWFKGVCVGTFSFLYHRSSFAGKVVEVTLVLDNLNLMSIKMHIWPTKLSDSFSLLFIDEIIFLPMGS